MSPLLLMRIRELCQYKRDHNADIVHCVSAKLRRIVKTVPQCVCLVQNDRQVMSLVEH